MPRGGKRNSGGRPLGSGKYGEPTVPYRVPVSMVETLSTLLELYQASRDKLQSLQTVCLVEETKSKKTKHSPVRAAP